MYTVRLAQPHDASSVAHIYAPIVRDTAISFEIDPPDEDEIARRISSTIQVLPWLVAEETDVVIGYAYAGPHRARPAYRWSVETSVYIADDNHGKGVGRLLYLALLALLRVQGFANAYAGITLPNEASLGFHQALGFVDVGVFRRVGFKHGSWHDVWWGALDLAPDRADPSDPLSLPHLQASGQMSAVLSQYKPQN